jgi:hypothetical protein
LKEAQVADVRTARAKWNDGEALERREVLALAAGDLVASPGFQRRATPSNRSSIGFRSLTAPTISAMVKKPKSEQRFICEILGRHAV